jgi:hypothetical protein
VGRQLLKLSVSTSDAELEVDSVLRMCPKLQTLSVFAGYPPSFVVERPFAPPPSLTELRLVMKIDGTSSLQRDNLLPLLRALPNLRVLRLKNFVFEQQDDALFGDALKRGELLQQLHTFSCCYEWLDRLMEVRMRS